MTLVMPAPRLSLRLTPQGHLSLEPEDDAPPLDDALKKPRKREEKRLEPFQLVGRNEAAPRRQAKEKKSARRAAGRSEVDEIVKRINALTRVHADAMGGRKRRR